MVVEFTADSLQDAIVMFFIEDNFRKIAVF